MHGFFITGTDTGVGKTVVTCALARCLRQQGHRVAVCKPVATGAEQVGDSWLAEDTRLLAQTIGVDPLAGTITRWTFPEPAAPPVAAKVAGEALDLSEIVTFIRQQALNDGLLLVEGVGGLLCPLTESDTIADLIAELRLPVLVVARRTLGTLNHTLLTLEVAARRHLDVRGVIVNETEPVRSLADVTNVEELRQRIQVPVLAVCPFLGSAPRPSPPEMPELNSINWLALAAPGGI